MKQTTEDTEHTEGKVLRMNSRSAVAPAEASHVAAAAALAVVRRVDTKPTHQTALWFHGGNLHQSRHYSQFLSLQLKARMEGIPTPVYGMGPVHHLS